MPWPKNIEELAALLFVSTVCLVMLLAISMAMVLTIVKVVHCG